MTIPAPPQGKAEQKLPGRKRVLEGRKQRRYPESTICNPLFNQSID
jgi:hypothetical protein